MKNMTVRNIPDKVHAELVKLAAANRDSLNKTAVLALEQFVLVVQSQASAGKTAAKGGA